MICEFAKNIYDVELDCVFWSKSDLPFEKCCCPEGFTHGRRSGKVNLRVCPGYIPSSEFEQYRDQIIRAIMERKNAKR